MDFRKALAQSESSGRYGVVNDEGYTGRYQFGPSRLTDYMNATGQQFSMEQFRTDPELQERVQAWHERDILDYISSEGLDQYIGMNVGGVEITPTAMLGMAHLGGKAGMKKFLETGGEYNPSDSNDKSLRDYGQQFSGASEVPQFGELASDRQGLAGLDEDMLRELVAQESRSKDQGVFKALSYLSSLGETPEFIRAKPSELRRGRKRDAMARFREGL